MLTLLERVLEHTYDVNEMSKSEREDVVEIVAWSLRQSVPIQSGRMAKDVRRITVNALQKPHTVRVYFKKQKAPMVLYVNRGMNPAPMQH